MGQGTRERGSVEDREKHSQKQKQRGPCLPLCPLRHAHTCNRVRARARWRSDTRAHDCAHMPKRTHARARHVRERMGRAMLRECAGMPPARARAPPCPRASIERAPAPVGARADLLAYNTTCIGPYARATTRRTSRYGGPVGTACVPGCNFCPARARFHPATGSGARQRSRRLRGLRGVCCANRSAALRRDNASHFTAWLSRAHVATLQRVHSR